MSNRIFTAIILIFLLGSFLFAQKISSPNEKLSIQFSLINGIPHYSVNYAEKPVIVPSSLGFQFKEAPSLKQNFEIVESLQQDFSEVWNPVWGTSKAIKNEFNELIIHLKEKSPPNREMKLMFRAYDDGIGFRYFLPEQENLNDFQITAEETLFRFSDNHSCWWIPNDYESYEKLYQNTPLTQIVGVNTPFTMETTDGLYLSIHEADLTDYAGMTLERVRAEDYTLRSALVPWPDGIKVKASTPHRTPWRTIQIVENPGDLIESHLILNLNEPLAIEDPSWIKPMKYMGVWWGMHIRKYTWHSGPKHGATTEHALERIDYASKFGIPGLLIEGWNRGWEGWLKDVKFDFLTPYPDFDINKVVDYAKQKDIYIIGHHETGGDIPTYEAQMDSAFAYYDKLGIQAVKTGYAGEMKPEGMHHHGQWMVNHYRKVVKKAAEHKIMIDAHEPIKPTGISRTYPNMMTREGVRGMEYNAWSFGNPPEHTTIVPFTRMLAGPLDYTPGIFDLEFKEYQPENRVYTTRAKQLAYYAVLFSPLQMVADLPENYENQPEFEFIQKVPTTWDATNVLSGKIGDFVSIARKKGDTWYVGSITDEKKRELKLSLNFLDSEQPYVAQVFSDGAGADWKTNPNPVKIEKFIVNSGQTWTASLAPGGGQAIILSPATEDDLKKIPEY